MCACVCEKKDAGETGKVFMYAQRRTKEQRIGNNKCAGLATRAEGGRAYDGLRQILGRVTFGAE